MDVNVKKILRGTGPQIGRSSFPNAHLKFKNRFHLLRNETIISDIVKILPENGSYDEF